MQIVRGSMVLFILSLLASPAAAEDKAVARQAYSDGTKYYDLNQYAQALEAFKRAYWNYEEPVFLFNIAQCHRALGQNADALGFYRSYLRKSPDAPNRGEVQKIIADLERTIAQEKAVSSAPPKGTIGTGNTSAGPPEPTAQPSAAPVESVAMPVAKSEKPPRKRTWIWGVVAGVVAAGIAVGLGVGLGTQSHPPKATDGSVTF